ncbi:hypothetical protein [Sphingorhabdus sp.]|jgi:hypothetical protein|uniref:hypothetical protein n=1 Tax=Sphingorhabdus sp. TaxID=1902408 RepID=UPI003BB21EF1|nr:hypothetical protein [Sphingomonadales bacterium]MBK9432339.1 hypothetical protein [Sphingomonadales bacterium]MBL0022126.1 hypothetical protein [Sphingomonadales bacterium]
MPADELAEFAAKLAFRAVINVPELVFNKYVARYFHGVGRHLIMMLTLGYVRIPSSLRMVPKGTKPRPTAQDWAALIVGILTWGASAAAVCFALFGL